MPEADKRGMTNHLKEFKTAQQPRTASSLKWESASERLPADSHDSADALAADEVQDAGAEVEVEPNESAESLSSAEVASHSKESVRSPFPCHICGRKLSAPDGYLLTTTEVVGSHLFWKRFYRQRYDELGTRLIYTYRDFSRDESIRELYVDPVAAREKPWLVCGECVQMFSINRKRAQGHAKWWWESDQTFLPPGNGAAPATAINLQGPWYGRIGPAVRSWTWGLLIIACVATAVVAIISIPIRNHFTQVPPLSLTPATPAGPTTPPVGPTTPPDASVAPPSDADSTTPEGATTEPAPGEPAPGVLAPGEPAPGDQGLLPEVDDPAAAETSPPDITPADDRADDRSVVAPSVEPMRLDEGASETDAEPPSEPAVATSPNRAFDEGTEQTAEQPPATPNATLDGEAPVGPEANAAAEPVLRTWTDRQGRTIKARLIRVSEGRVTLERVDGKTAEIELKSLSEADQDYVSTQTVSSILRPMTLTFTMTFTMTPTMTMVLKPTETPHTHDTADAAGSLDR